MMKIIFFIVFLLTGTKVFAEPGFKCESFENEVIEAIIAANTVPMTMTVKIDGDIIYSKVPVASFFNLGERSFRSPSFINANGSHSILELRIWSDSNELSGSLGEITSKPTFPRFHDISCERFQ